MMIPQHVIVGGGVILLCLMGLAKEQWLFEKTANGRRLVQWFGIANAPWVFRGMMAIAIVFGGLLALKIIRPIQW